MFQRQLDISLKESIPSAVSPELFFSRAPPFDMSGTTPASATAAAAAAVRRVAPLTRRRTAPDARDVCRRALAGADQEDAVQEERKRCVR